MAAEEINKESDKVEAHSKQADGGDELEEKGEEVKEESEEERDSGLSDDSSPELSSIKIFDHCNGNFSGKN